jgi:hypothetical protein
MIRALAARTELASASQPEKGLKVTRKPTNVSLPSFPARAREGCVKRFRKLRPASGQNRMPNSSRRIP